MDKITKYIIDNIVDLKLRKEYNNLHQFLKDKNVEIVGPAQTMVGKKYGKEIEKADVIIRLNTVVDFLPFNDKQKEDFGGRMDVLYTIPNIVRVYLRKPKVFKNIIEKCGVKWIVIRPNSHEKCSTNNGKWVKDKSEIHKYFSKMPKEEEQLFRDFNNFVSKEKLTTKLFFSGYSHTLLSYLLSDLKGRPIVSRTGFLPIFDCLALEVKSLNIKGMTFCHKGGHLFREVKIGELHPLLNVNGKTTYAHDGILELEIMKRLDQLYKDKLQYDETLKNLIHDVEPYKKLYSDEKNKEIFKTTNKS